MFLILILSAYLLGSIPFGFLVGKYKKIDIRKEGSKNIGATNVNRTIGLKFAILVGILDILKGFIPTILAISFFSNPLIIASVGFSSILGHVFPVFLKFKGGKGVSTYAGVLLAIIGIKIFIILGILWVSFLYISKLMSLTNLIFVLLVSFLFFVLGSNTYFVFSLSCALLIWYTHRENIDRLVKHQENKVSFRKNK